jgi:hypothetical protein
MPEDHFGERVAPRYDGVAADHFAPEVLDPAVDFLAALAGDGAALEFAVGTGRVALPLAARGVPVHGIDLSEAMVAQLRAKPGSDRVPVTVGDIASTRVDGSFRLVYLVFNTIPNLTSQDEQVACFANAAAHLEPGGCFVIEVGVPSLRRLPPGETIRAATTDPRKLDFDVFDCATQSLVSHHYAYVDGQLQDFPVPFRYVWPGELDLMARLAGMSLLERWSDWHRSPFTHESEKHVSVWRKPA